MTPRVSADQDSLLERVVIIGFGNMGRALARGLLRRPNTSLSIVDRFVQPSQEELQAQGLDPKRIHWIGESDSHALSETSGSGPITYVIATKPQNLAEVMTKWRVALTRAPKETLVISILAGIPTLEIEALLGLEIPVIRAMPNIAATVDQAATVIAGGRYAEKIHLERATRIFDAVGRTWISAEEHLNAVTGLSGSGPAYIYMVIEALSDGGVKMGLSRQLSLELATQTVIGAGILVRDTKTHPAVLRDQVTTPGGTTISAIHELERHGLRAMLIQAVVTATRKSALLLQKAVAKKAK
jgi:pyrroline-5-carboxylate reductase